MRENRNVPLGVAQVEKGLGNWPLAVQANEHLPLSAQLSELSIAKFRTHRKKPTQEQADAIAIVLGKPRDQLFTADEVRS